MNNLRSIPNVMLCRRHGKQPVTSCTALPPTEGKHPGPIVSHLTCIDIALACGHHRYYGSENARINSHLRMEVSVNPRDEIASAWPLPSGRPS